MRRDNIACVADSRSYALLDVDRQLKIPLMSISSLDDSQASGPLGQVQNIAGGADGGLLRSASSAGARRSPAPDSHGHARSTSLGGFITSSIHKPEKKAAEAEDTVFQESESPAPSRSPALAEGPSNPPADAHKPLPAPPGDAGATLAAQAGSATPAGRTASPARPTPVLLKPHILSPTPEEFLLVTGVGPLDPGIGMFVNLDGDPTRPTLEFERYPRELVVDGGSSDLSSSKPSLGDEEEGYVLASMAKEFESGLRHGLEIQRFDVNMGEAEREKFWLELKAGAKGNPGPDVPLGVNSLMSSDEMQFQEVADRLRQKRFSPFSTGTPERITTPMRRLDSRTDLSIERMSKERELFDHGLDSDDEALADGWEDVRNREEQEYASRLAKVTSRLAVWAGNTIWWAARNPLLLQLEARLEAYDDGTASFSRSMEERGQLLAILNSIHGRDAKTELEFMTFRYIRQRAGVLMFASFLHSEETPFTEPELNAMEEVLLDGGLDPRVVLALIPPLRNEIVESRRGIWIHQGVKSTVERCIPVDEPGKPIQPLSSLSKGTIQFLRRFLTAWRRNKDFGSIADKNQVFRTVDAALLVVLLELDQSSPGGSARVSLYELVDSGVDCFDRAVDLLETYHRLFVLSRLYQSRKMAADVLGTWRRITEGERDDGGELGDGEQRVRTYLSNINNQALVQEYGVWLATRNPKLGVQVFADDKGRAKFDPTEVINLLREEAPDAVKYYLEYLVFSKGHTAYVNELITYYLDIVIDDLESSAGARATVTASYEAYRALRPPKPTYRQFLTDNAPPGDEVWQSRLRLLQLLGGAHEYDSKAIRSRITTTFPGDSEDQLLVPEAIILNGRERQHDDSLRLLVHRLGDYDTAVSYCLRGGGSIYTPTPGRRESMPSQETQTHLFRVLLKEFLALEDISDRVEQTGALLQRFGGWFDVLEVLALIPDSWSVDITTEFLVAALRRLVREKHESMLARSLSSAENLRVNYDRIVKVDEMGPVVDAGQ